MAELTISEKFKTLTKKQLKALDNTDHSCQCDLHDHIEMMYEFNQEKKLKKVKS